MKVSVSKIDNNITSFARKNSPQNGNVSFGSKRKACAELVKKLSEKDTALPKFLEWLGNNDGEILNTIVTGIGTAFIAPIFIAFNPFSKEDKETKIYSAWRQPISAILAVAAQIGINTQYNKHIDKVASLGKFDRANLEAFPMKSYLKGIIKKEHPEYTKEQINAEIEKRQIDARWKAINEAREKLVNEHITYDQLIDDEAKRLAKNEIKSRYKDELEKMSFKQREKFIAEKLPAQAEQIVEQQVTESARGKALAREWIRDAKQKNIPYETLLQIKEKEMKALNEISANNITDFAKGLEKLKSYGGYDNVKYLDADYAKVLQYTKIKRLVYANIDKARSVLGSYRRWTGILISLATLPVSCGLLNYIYPRLMEKIMPNVKHKKHCNAPSLKGADTLHLHGKEVRK